MVSDESVYVKLNPATVAADRWNVSCHLEDLTGTYSTVVHVERREWPKWLCFNFDETYAQTLLRNVRH